MSEKMTPDTLRALADITDVLIGFEVPTAHTDAIRAAADAWEDDRHSLELAREDKVTQWVEISNLRKRLEAAEHDRDWALREIRRLGGSFDPDAFAAVKET